MIRLRPSFYVCACATGVAALAVAACASHPAPVDQMASAEGAARAAQEVGADTNPTAQLHLRLAREEIARAHTFMDQGDNERADFTLLRARADADLALELARESRAQVGAKTAADKAIEATPSTPPASAAPGAQPMPGAQPTQPVQPAPQQPKGEMR
jgi:hypothetical protein